MTHAAKRCQHTAQTTTAVGARQKACSGATATNEKHRAEAEQEQRRGLISARVAAARTAAVVGARPAHALIAARGHATESARARARHRVAARDAVLVTGAIVTAAARSTVAVAGARRTEPALRARTGDAHARVADFV